MATDCFSLAQGKRMRVTTLDDCGNYPDPGTECSLIVSSGFVSVAGSSEMEDGTDIRQTNANGDLVYATRSIDQFVRLSLEIEFAEVDPDLFALLANVDKLTDWNGDVVGFAAKEGAPTQGFALEVWSGIPGEECPAGAEVALGYWLFPWVMPGAIGDFTIENDGINFTFTGFTRSGGGWGTGPYDVVETDAMGTAGPLDDPVAADQHWLVRKTGIDAPAAACGCQAMPGS